METLGLAPHLKPSEGNFREPGNVACVYWNLGVR